MWLPKLDRDLLTYYYKKACSGRRWAFLHLRQIEVDLDEVIKELGYLQGAGTLLKIDEVNVDLEERKLIKVYKKVSEGKYGVRLVQLSIEGKDLGRKYSSKLDTIGLWCAAKEHQWLWYLITFVAGFLANWLIGMF